MRADAQRNYQRLLSAANAPCSSSAAPTTCRWRRSRAGPASGSARCTGTSRPARRCWRPCTATRWRRSAPARTSYSIPTRPARRSTAWLRALLAFSRTKHSMMSALLATLGKDSELLSSCSTVIVDAAGALLKRAQVAGVGAPGRRRRGSDSADARGEPGHPARSQRPGPDRPAARPHPGRPPPPADPERVTSPRPAPRQHKDRGGSGS